jgi:hypothetical protein
MVRSSMVPCSTVMAIGADGDKPLLPNFGFDATVATGAGSVVVVGAVDWSEEPAVLPSPDDASELPASELPGVEPAATSLPAVLVTTTVSTAALPPVVHAAASDASVSRAATVANRRAGRPGARNIDTYRLV